MPRPKGSKNRTHKPPTKVIGVRLSKAELAKLRRIHRVTSKAIHALIAGLPDE